MSLFGDIAGAFGAEKAEDAQFAAGQRAAEINEARYQQTRRKFQPYTRAGSGAMDIISRLYGLDGEPADMSAFEASPGYQFRLQQGLDALQNSAAARGGLFSGAAGQAINDYAGASASQEFDNYLNRLFGVAGQGANMTSNLSNIAMGNAASLGNIAMSQGQGQADAINNQFGAWGSMGDQAAAAIMGGFAPVPGGAAAGAAPTGFNWSQAGKIFMGA